MMSQSARRILIGLVVLQVVILLVMPVFAGPQIPRHTVVTLAAKVIHQDKKASEEYDTGVIDLDYGFDQLKVPTGIKANHKLYVELRGDASSDKPMTLGKVVSEPADLPEGAVWLKLMRDSEHRKVNADELTSHYEADATLQKQLESIDSATVAISLSRDGDATINDVKPEK